ncbi:MAG: hypothetical protein NTV01_21615 [Bacteroidia bacterium]|nr:hypothetical protein [Bacteroidia bacterium]
MNTEENVDAQPCRNRKVPVNSGASGAVYGLGLIGAAIYFIGHAATFWAGVLGFLKAIIWPVFMVIKAFEFMAK